MGCCCDKISDENEPLLSNSSSYHIILDKKQLEKRRKLLDVTSRLSVEIMHIRSFLLENDIHLEPMAEPSLYLNSIVDDFELIKKNKIDLSTMKWKNNHLIIPVFNHEIRIATKTCSENEQKRILYMLNN